MWIAALLFIIALASVVSAQSNMNCDVWQTSGSPPATDYVALFRFIGNDSHVQVPSMSDYPYTVGCNSSIATLGSGCSGTYVNVVQLFQNNDSHVSVYNYYPNQLCFNTSTASRSFYYNISLTSATPAGFECVFAIAKMNDSHVYECDNANATYNVNLKINSTVPPYSGCVDLDNASTFQGKVINNSDGYWFVQSASLCQKTYYKNDTGTDGVIIMNATGITLNCNNSILLGNGTGYGVVMDNFNYSKLLGGCKIANYTYSVYNAYQSLGYERGMFANITNITVYSSNYGFYSQGAGCYARDITAYNNTKGVYMTTNNFIPCNFSYMNLYNNTNGLHVYSSGSANVSHIEVSNSSSHGIVLEQYLYKNIFYNISSHDNAGSGIYYDGPSDGGQLSNITGARIYNNGQYGIYVIETLQPFIYRDADIYSNSYGGVYLRRNPGDTFDNVTIRDNGGIGIFMYGDGWANNVEIYNSRIFKNSGAGIVATDNSGQHTFWNVSVYNNTVYGIYMLGYNFSTNYAPSGIYMMNVTSANQTYNLYFNNTFDSTIRNSSFSNSTYNVYLVNSTNNTFYYNRFIDSSALHAYSDRSGSYFNTSYWNGTAWVAHGNYWDDILTLDILDLNGDGFGETGTEYPYNSTYSSKVNANVTDWGPITTKGCVDGDGDGFYPYSASPACPGTYRDCDDTNASILPPKDELIPTADTILCNGTYYVDDASADGLIKSGASNIKITCNGTTIIGDGTGSTFYIDDERVTVNNCTIHTYARGIYALYANYSSFTNNTAFNISEGFYLVGGHDNNLTQNTALNNSQSGFRVIGSSYGILLNNTAYYSSGNCFMLSESSVGSLRNNLTDNTAHDCDFDGFSLSAYSGLNWLANNTAYDVGTGFRIASFNNTFRGNSAYNNSADGFHQESSLGFGIPAADNNTYIENSACNNTDAGFNFVDSGYSTLISNRASDNGPSNGDGFRFAHSYANNLTLNIAERNSMYGFNFMARFGAGSVNNKAANNTIDGNDYGVYLDSLSTGNLFYFNDFLNSVTYDAYAAAAGNFFNTTNGSDCGALCARGNYWDDILSLDIIDSNADGFGDSGTDYPYNAANGGNVSANVQDEGPITTKTAGADAVPPTGSIVIYGYNGTEITGSRNVFLNLTFADETCLGWCRWANDDESNLTGMPWENCTTVKPWILSEDEGNKTVYYQIRDCAGNNVTLNDSIWYRFMQDFTPPTSPVVYDSDYGYDIDWWNDNTALSAYWWNATDDISAIYYKYRILNDSDCYVSGCPWTDVGPDTDVTVTGLSLQEGWNMSFEVFAYTASGLNASVVSSNGTWIDLTKPTAPIINSTTHPLQYVTYDNGTVRFNFTSTDPLGGGVASGVEGYSYVLDRHPGTAPDNNMEGRYWFMLESMVNDGYEQLLRANSSVGSPNTYAVYSQLHENFTAGENVRVRVAMAERASDYDDEMRVKVFLISTADGAGVGAFTFGMEGSAITTISNVSRDVKYSELMTAATMYEFNVQVTSTTTDDANDIYVVVTGVPGDNDNRNNLSMAGSTTDIDNSTNLFICNNTPSCGDYTYVLDLAVEVKKEDAGSVWDVQYDDLQDGSYYFHVKAKDVAGNWGDTGHYNVTIDTAGVAVDIISPFTGQLFTTENVTVTVEVNEQANVTVYAMHPDGSNDTSDWKVFTGRDTFNVTMENGTNRLYARAINPENNVVTYSQDVYVLFGTDIPSGPKTLRVLYSGVSCSGHVCSVNEGGASGTTIGIAVENDSAVFGADDILSDTGAYTIKIFATNPSGVGSKVESELSDDEFLDRVQPLFGYERGVPYYIIRTETRPANVYLDGEQRLGSGRYTLIFKNVGTTPEGKANITVRIG